MLIAEYLGLFIVQTTPYYPRLVGIEITPIATANDNRIIHF